MEGMGDLATKKPKRLTSIVWDHFERIKKADICYALCVHCNKKLSGSSNSGTTHLRNHLVRCLKRSNFDVSHLLAAKKRRKDNAVDVTSVTFDECQRKDDYLKPKTVTCDSDNWRNDVTSAGSSRFDQERSRLDLARMIILHRYPLAMVDHVGFKVFVKNLQPLFDVGHNSAIEITCMEIYLREKQRVYQMISKLRCKVSLSIQMWSSSDNLGGLSITAHYIDEWELQNKVLNFITLDSSHNDNFVTEMIIKCFMEWDLAGKLLAITFDDCLPGKNAGPSMKDQILAQQPQFGKAFYLDSAGHMINTVVQDVMNEESLHELILKVRRSVRSIKSSQAKLNKFSEIAQCIGISSQKSLVLDSPVRWSSTYLMLETALEYRSVFAHLWNHDHEFESPLKDEEWERASSLSGYLKLFFDITGMLSRTEAVTANMYFPEICDVHVRLIAWCKSPDSFFSCLAMKMKSKFEKYWDKCSFILAVAAFLDPRFKIKLVEYYYSQIYGSTALERIKEVSDGIKELFDLYSDSLNAFDDDLASPDMAAISIDNGDRLKGFDKYLHETSQNQYSSSELNKYLDEPVFPRDNDFNILNWWKVHTPRYPILSMMARDILGIPVSIAMPESGYSSGKQMLHSCYNGLSSDTRQTLICSRDWLRIAADELLPSSSHYAGPLWEGEV